MKTSDYKIIVVIGIITVLSLIFIIGSFVIPRDFDCPTADAFECGYGKGLLVFAKRWSKGLSLREGEALKNEVITRNYLGEFLEWRGVEIRFLTDCERSSTNGLIISLCLDNTWEGVYRGLLFEIGHIVYGYDYCPKQNVDGLVCRAYKWMPELLLHKAIVQSHLFAWEFYQSDGRLWLDPTYEYDEKELIDSLVDIDWTDPYVIEILSTHNIE